MQTTKLQTEWVNILSKGLITIPKKIREEVGMKEGDIAKVRVEGNKIIIEPKEENLFSEVRNFTAKQLQQWVKEDTLPSNSAKKTEAYWKDLP